MLGGFAGLQLDCNGGCKPALSLRGEGLGAAAPMKGPEELETWRKESRAKVMDLMGMPSMHVSGVEFGTSFEHDGVVVTPVQWQLPWGPSTQAVMLKPASASARKSQMPGVLALHCHGCVKRWGYEKIVQLPGQVDSPQLQPTGVQ
eukprot:gene837-2553_t